MTDEDVFQKESDERRNNMRIEVIKTAILLLEEDLPKCVRGKIERTYCNNRMTFFKDQPELSYDTTFCRSLYSFLSNFVETFYHFNPRTNSESYMTERNFIYKEILDQVENFVHDL